jgi:hypothetical protein
MKIYSEKMEITIKTVKDKRRNKLLFRIFCDDKSTSNLNYDEMIGLVSALTMPEERPTQLLLTEQQREEVNNIMKQ